LVAQGIQEAWFEIQSTVVDTIGFHFFHLSNSQPTVFLPLLTGILPKIPTVSQPERVVTTCNSSIFNASGSHHFALQQ
jgi:hypothetical protein